MGGKVGEFSMDVDLFLWNAFSQTGSIDAYLLYKSTQQEHNEDREKECQLLEQRVL